MVNLHIREYYRNIKVVVGRSLSLVPSTACMWC